MATTPTAGDMRLFFIILKNCDGKINTNWDAVARDAGLKSADVAKTRYGQIKRKYEKDFNANGTAASPSNNTPSKPAAAKGTPSKNGSGVKKATGRVGGKGKTPKKEPVAKQEKNLLEDVPIPGLKVEDDEAVKTVGKASDPDAGAVVLWMQKQNEEDDDVFA